MNTGANINIFWAKVLVEELARSGVRDVVISPGSRSTPLVLAFAAHPDIEDHSVIDERSAAFHALGIAKASGRPVVLLCTSGTAAANYLPAVCEADASRIPLILCTADRPAHIRSSGAPQTMDQLGLYGNHVRYFHEMPQPEADEEKLRALRAITCHAVAQACGQRPGPVHLNLPFRKPLEPMLPHRTADVVPSGWAELAFESNRGRVDGRAWTQYLRFKADGQESSAWFHLLDILLRSRRPLILAGPLAPVDGLRGCIAAFTERHGIPVFAEAASNIRYGAHSPVIFGSSDLLLRSSIFRGWLKPDLVIQLGGAPTNSGMQRFLDELEDVPMVVVAPSIDRADPSHRASMHITAAVGELLAGLDAALASYPSPDRDSDWLSGITAADSIATNTLDDELSRVDESFEGKVAARIGKLLPRDAALFLSSSMPIRDAETFLTRCEQEMAVLFNRGVNGIDGILSTALGVARERPCVLVTGDIAVLHNLNALAGEGLSALRLTVVLLNNQGGEIFELLPVREFEPGFTRHFLTPHSVDFGAVFKAFGVQHTVAQSWEHFDASMHEALRHPKVAVVEVRTEIRSSGELRRALLLRVAEAIDAACADLPELRDVDGPAFPLQWCDHGGEGIPVLLLHGFTRAAASWSAVRRLKGNRRIITLDLMGHGSSPLPDAMEHAEAWTLAGASARIDDMLRLLGIERVHLAGYSLGARTALSFALAFPDRLDSLALISGNPGIEDAGSREARRVADEVLADSIEHGGLDRFVRAWGTLPLFRTQMQSHPAEWRLAQHDRRMGSTRGFAASLRGSGQGVQLPAWDRLKEIGCPIFAAAGEDDESYAAIAQRIASISGAELHCFARCGHDVPLEATGELATALNAFWKRAEERDT